MAVILLVGLASLLGTRERTGDVHAAAKTPAGAAAAQAGKSPSEPLAELGVQPAPANDKSRQTAGALPDAVAPGQKVPDLEPDPRLDQSR